MIRIEFQIDCNGCFILDKSKCLISEKGEHKKKCETLLEQLSALCSSNNFTTDRSLEGNYHFAAYLHNPKEFRKKPSISNHYMFGQNYFLEKEKDGSVTKKHIDDNDFLPIVHFFKYDDYKKIEFRYFNIVESSIWNYLVTYTINEENVRYFRGINYALSEIAKNSSKGIYKLSVAREFAELNARMTKQAYLEETIDNSGHGQYVAPFIFHSERETGQMFDNEFVINRKTIDTIKSHKWRILLVDDKAKQPMDIIEDENNGEHDKSDSNVIWDNKLKIIKGLLLSVFGDSNMVTTNKEDNCNILIEYVETLDAANAILKEKEFDIILLDYLLKAGKKPQYGYELLEDIYTFVTSRNLTKEIEDKNLRLTPIFENLYNNSKYEELGKYIKSDKKLSEKFKSITSKQDKEKEQDWRILFETIQSDIKKNNYKIGPQKRLYFIFISAYSSAVYERLLAQGLNLSEDYWYISLGACPTNTPKLFLYNLIKLMEKRLDDSGILKLSSNEIFKLIDKIYQDSKRDSVRKRANALYQKVLSLQYHYRSILKDVEIPFGHNANEFETKGSVLMTNFIRKKINLGGMLEHLTQLVHLTAFGTIRQWPEMWEEYIYFKAQFEKQLDKDNDTGNVDYGQLFSNIEDYILELKSQQR